jgi:hypothetical protein
VISPSQRPLPDNTQHSQQTDIHTPSGIRTHSLSRRATADPLLDRAATGTGLTLNTVVVVFKAIKLPNLTLCKSGHGISVAVLSQKFLFAVKVADSDLKCEYKYITTDVLSHDDLLPLKLN